MKQQEISPFSRYALKRKGSITIGPAGNQRPLLDGPRLALTQCGCPRESNCPRCLNIVRALARPHNIGIDIAREEFGHTSHHR